MDFFMNLIPPTSTAQMHKVKVVKGRPIFYDPPEVAEARNLLTANLIKHKPENPLEGPVALKVLWLFPKGKHKNGEWKVTKPDTDNLEKLLKDCMTRVGFWKDDAQVVSELCEKRWADEPSGIYIEVNTLKEVV